MNGQDRAEENFAAFEKWAATKSDIDFREIITNGRLNRGEICRECNFGRSALVQNPRIKEALHALEERLRTSGVLPRILPNAPIPLRQKGQMQAVSDAERLKRLEAENAGMRAEINEMRSRLKRFEAIEVLLGETGRLPR
jgi:hypothetical protein